MTIIMCISVLIGVWMSATMRSEILTGFYRVQDYAVSLPLLLLAVALLNLASHTLLGLDGVIFYLALLVQLPLAFGVLVLTWAATLLVSVLALRFFTRRA